MGWKPAATTSDADAIHDNVAAEISIITEKTTPVNADLVIIEDSAASNAKKKVQVGNLPGGSGATVPEWIEYLAIRQADETSHTDDDFFDNASIGFTTELDVSGTSTGTESRDLLSVIADDQTTEDVAAQLKAITSASAPMTIETCLRIQRTDSDLAIAGLSFSDGVVAGSNSVRVYYYVTAGVLHWAFTEGTYTAHTTTFDDINFGTAVPQQQLYLQLIWAAANSWKARLSIDGVTWYAPVGAQSDTMTPDSFGVWASTWGGTTPMLASYEYFRVYDSDESV